MYGYQMHEMKIALNIVDIVEEESIKAHASRINDIEIEIGAVSGIDIQSLKFALESAVKNTLLENSVMRITTIPAKIECLKCGEVFFLDDFYQFCPKCDSSNLNLLQGKELRIKSINID